mmetsp:Transcript_30917/g.91861  ORF Transcript_30917/g.91861 Transcript_30917/m.91861 type:complete len:474 (-) Transcript_30917:252-1673(-)
MIRTLMGGGGGNGGGGGMSAERLEDAAPSWEALAAKLDTASTDDERAFRQDLESGRAARACSLASQRLFDLPDGEAPRLTLFRDTAAWCPYCEKVWLVLEEKRVPYEVKKVNMNCYGDKPAWFWAIQPSGGIPVAKLDGQVIRESNDIIMAVEEAFPDRPLLPQGDPRVRPLLSLERELFSAWFRWLTSSASEGAQRANFEALLRRVDGELAASGGPYFLGADLSLVDCMFAPFLERMAASLPYYKALTLRRNDGWPRIEQWFLAMESRPSYRHVQSDFYTHVHDLPPQIGRCQSVPEAEELAAEIDGSDGSWSLPLPEDDGSLLQPLQGLGAGADAARREAAERLLHNHEAIGRFAARGLSAPGFPPVAAELSDPNAAPAEEALPVVDALLRHTTHALLDGEGDAGAAALSPDTLSGGIEPRAAAASLGYLRDRISVPRDMSYPAARQLRAHLNGVIEGVGAKAAAAAAAAS